MLRLSPEPGCGYDRRNGRKIGEVKAATWSPILKANIALADLELGHGQLPQNLWARIEYQRELKRYLGSMRDAGEALLCS